MNRFVLFLVLLVVSALVPLSRSPSEVNVGSKKFTESVILGELITQSFSDAAVSAKHFQELGGTQIAFRALLDGEIDVYPEYTGTIREELFAGRDLSSHEEIRDLLVAQGIEMTEPLGFNNTYALALTEEAATRRGIDKVSDLSKHPNLRFGLGNEFLDRGDGWPALSEHYGFHFSSVTGLDHDIAYRQLSAGDIDVMDVYSTDAKIDELGLRPLIDDRKFFPRYDAVLLYRRDLLERFPELQATLDRFGGSLSESTMIALNRLVEVDGKPEARVASEFLASSFGIQTEVRASSRLSEVFARLIEHLELVRKSLIPAILIGIPMGVLAYRLKGFGTIVLSSVGILQTIPALALLVMLMPVVTYLGGQSIGTGSLTAILALFLYSLLPIVRGTYSGLASIEPYYVESAEAMGLPAWFRMWNVELPLAIRSMLSGIKTAAVMNIGFATLGALIGAGGFGQPILTGIRLADTGLILEGAIPAALLAVVTQWLFDVAERLLLNAGMKT